MTKMKNKKSYKLSGAAIIALVVCVVILFNVAFTALASKYVWQVDMTSGKVYSLSDEFKEVLSSVNEGKEEPAEVNIYFAQEPDDLMSGTDSSEYMKYIYQTALQMSNEYDYINLQCVSVVKYPDFFKKYISTEVTNIKTTNVIVESGDESRVLAADAFFTWDEDYESIWAYNGEKKFASTILSLTSETTPIAYFTTHHGETVDDDALALKQLYEDAGFSVVDIDLSTEEISDSARVLVINDPTNDFGGFNDAVNEIDKIDSFLEDYGSLMVFVDQKYADSLVNLKEFLTEWGFSFTGGSYVRDKSNAVSLSGKALVADYASDTLGASIYTDISSLDTMPNTVLDTAMPIDLIWGEGEKGGSLGSPREASAVLLAKDGSELIDAETGETTDASGSALMAISRETSIVNNENYYTYVTVCGTPSIASNLYLNSNVYANHDIIYSTVKATSHDQVIADIDFKVLDETELSNTTAQADVWLIVLTLAFPVIFGVIGLVVWIRRKYA